MLDELNLAPVLDLQMRLGEGTGACLLMGLIEASVKIMGEMATFESAGVEEKTFVSSFFAALQFLTLFPWPRRPESFGR